MRNKAKVKSSGPAPMEMIIKINNENVVLEVIPPAGMIPEETDPELDPLTSQTETDLTREDEEIQDLTHENEDEEGQDFEDEDPDGIPSDDRKVWHNKSERMRRAQLRSSMERLKLLVPLEDSNQKYTTVNLLRKAKQLIHKLEEKQKKNMTFRDQLMKEQKYLRKRLDSLQLEVKGQGGQPVAVSAPRTLTSSTPSSAKNYPANLPLSQSAPPMILKRSKVSEVNNSDVILIDGPRVTSTRNPAGNANPTAVFATVPMGNSTTTTYQVVGNTTDQFVSDNFCFILDTSALE